MDSAFKVECPERRKIKEGASLGDLVTWARALASDYDACREMNSGKIRAIEILESQADRG